MGDAFGPFWRAAHQARLRGLGPPGACHYRKGDDLMTDTPSLQAALDQIDRAFGKRERTPEEAAMRRQLAEHPEVDAPTDLVDLGFHIVGLVTQFSDEGTSVDRGCGMGQFD